MLQICAEYADTWNSTGTPDEMRERNRMLDTHCAAIGRDPNPRSRPFYGWTAKIGYDPCSSVEAFEQLINPWPDSSTSSNAWPRG
jgi:alkanesulfonate monooxygenase SsuD/methylene tetrahydromethanopterin reductase-like flavin-dependent oxidoreductase (luciferase family)